MQIVFIACFCVWFVMVGKIPSKIMKLLFTYCNVHRLYFNARIPRRCRPFDCEYCLAFWLCLGVNYKYIIHFPIQIIVLSAACSLLAFTIGLILKKLQ